ncbi:hypothetical protein R1flu_013965 [Riccia fluitans]|uniref:Phosphate transporter n=1 Tax=Riccia fluitans TaxID=41844 RepID=A0ABD1YFV6_9MARC
MAVLNEYVWLVVAGAFFAFGFGWGTGANDVANAFGTSVGSKTLTLRQAVVIASIFEFAGALLLGRTSTNTIASHIADINAFAREPEVYAYGMVCALFVGTLWLIVTSYYGLNVSSTHTIIGGIIGFALVWDGPKAIVWAQKDSVSFPPYKGVIAIVLSWFVAPLLTAAVSAFILYVVRTLVLRRQNAYDLAFWTLPPFVLLTSFVNVYFILTKGIKQTLAPNSRWSNNKAAWVAFVIAVGITLCCIVFALPLLRRHADRHFDGDGNAIDDDAKSQKAGDTKEAWKSVDFDPPKVLSTWQKFSKAATHGMDVDIHRVVQENQKVGDIHEYAERFDPRVEYAFSYLQVFSATCVIFAHGSGEVGYMAGPLATIWDVYLKGELSRTIKPPIWILLICTFGLVVGLATYGYNVTMAMGVKLAKLTPTRGFAAELATAFVIMIGSQYSLPTSSSQCITGAIIGVGLLEGVKGVNWTLFVKQFLSWVSTLVVIGLFVSAIFAQGVYSPSKTASQELNQYEDRLTNVTNQVYTDFSSSLQSYKRVSDAGLLVNLPPATWANLNFSVSNAASRALDLSNPKKIQSVNVDQVLSGLYESLSLLQNYTVFTLGQNTVFPGADVCIDPSSVNISAAPCKSPRLLPQAYITSLN